MDLVPQAGILAGSANSTFLASDDFNLRERSPHVDVGAYRAATAGNSGWPLQAGFKYSDILFVGDFEL